MARAATGFTIVLSSLAEKGFDSQSSVHGLTLEGFGARITEAGPVLENVYARIVEEEGLDGGAFAYLSTPYAQLGLVLAGCAAGSLRPVDGKKIRQAA